MIDATTIMIAGVLVQAASPTRAMLAALGPRLRGPGVLASIAFAPLPHPTPAAHLFPPAIATVASER